MVMEHAEQRLSEDKDLLIQHTNRLLTCKGFDKLKDAILLTRGELKEAIGTLKKMTDTNNDFTSKDAIVLHFNRYTNDGNPKHQFTEHVATYKFPTKIVAKAFIEATIREAWERVPTPSKKWLSTSRFALNDWIVITANGPHTLEHIMEVSTHKYKLPAPYDYYAEQIMAYHWGAHPQVNERSRGKPMTPEEKEKHAPPSRARESNQRQQAQTKAPKVPKPASQSRDKAPVGRSSASQASPQRPRSASGSTISLEALCDTLKLEPREVRQALRTANYPKPGHRWEWDKKDIDKITADIKRICK